MIPEPLGRYMGHVWDVLGPTFTLFGAIWSRLGLLQPQVGVPPEWPILGLASPKSVPP